MTFSPEAAIADYFSRMTEIRSTGGATGETSFYSALESLLNAFGRPLTPGVICNGQLRSQGAGHPDFGLYTRQQCQQGEPRPGVIPERGVVEVKRLSDSSWQTASSEQVTRYFERYRLVLVTNYRDFCLIGEDENGKPCLRESYCLAPDEASFWVAAAQPWKCAREHAVLFAEFLRRVLLSAAPLARPEDVAWFLASYAREALSILEAKSTAALTPLREALESSLGIKFEGAAGHHFFCSTLVQTLFYGIFSAWIVRARTASSCRFDWRHAGFILTVPMVRALFEEIARPSRLAPLGVMTVLERTGDTLNRVDTSAFFKSFDTSDAIQHFYEPFLQAFDPKLRKELGVWYTPKEVVRYMVERVDRALRSELAVKDGLADPRVYVLDPCCGTGAFLVEVLRKIEQTLMAKGDAALLGEDLREAASKRVFGFEIMTAPFVIAHWQVAEMLSRLGVKLRSEQGERPAIYLTNALTGWLPADGPQATLPLFPELEEERDAAGGVKRDVPILVILGNPPYNAFASVSREEEQGLVAPYKEGLVQRWKIRKFNLDELYVRFLRVAERRIAERTGQGVICFISSYSYVGDPSFVVVRERLLREFHSLWIDCLNGDSRETGKLTPTGAPDPSVFSTEFNPEGIRLGTAIGLFVRKEERSSSSTVRYRDFWGINKRQELLESLESRSFNRLYTEAQPTQDNRFTFRPEEISKTYRSWPAVTELCDVAPISGLAEKRHGRLLAVSKGELAERMKRYLDRSLDWAAVKAADIGPVMNAGRFDARAAREKLLKEHTFDLAAIRRYALFPLDHRWCYYCSIRPLWNEPRPSLVHEAAPGERWFVTRMVAERPNENVPAIMTGALPDHHLLRPNVVAIPLRLRGFSASRSPDLLTPLLDEAAWKANLSAAARQYLRTLRAGNPDVDAGVGRAIWYHCLAICYSPLYQRENRDGILRDWPRLPLPATRRRLTASAALGAQLADLLDPDVDVPGVTHSPSALLALFGVARRRVGGALKPEEFSLKAGWGHGGGEDGAVMPGAGKVTEHLRYEPSVEAAIRQAAGDRRLGETLLSRLGPPVDIALNDAAYWSTIPAATWNYRIGGYQVIKKWLSYREESVLGRRLEKEEVRWVTGTIRRLTAIVLMGDDLDANYAAARDDSYTLPGRG